MLQVTFRERASPFQPRSVPNAAKPRCRQIQARYGVSGEWLNHVERSGHSLLGWLRDETGDRPGMGLQSMSSALSENEGLSWRRLGQIITGTDPVIQCKITGVGNCDAVDGKDGYYYAYCWWNCHPRGVIVARFGTSGLLFI